MTFFRHAKLTSTLLLSSALLIACSTEETPKTAANPDATASAADLSRRIEKLASDEFQGRAPSTPGGRAASQYIADEMKSAGLSPAAHLYALNQKRRCTSLGRQLNRKCCVLDKAS